MAASLAKPSRLNMPGYSSPCSPKMVDPHKRMLPGVIAAILLKVVGRIA